MANPELDVAKLAFSYKRLVLWFGVQLVVALVAPAAMVFVADPALGTGIALARLLVLLVTIVVLGLYAYRTAQALGSGVGFLWALAMLVPFVNVVTLLVLSSRATKACRRAGIPVGLFGPKSLQPVVGSTLEGRGRE